MNDAGQLPARSTAREIDPSDVVYPAPGGGTLRVPVGGGAAAPVNGTLNGQLWQYDATAGLWLPTPTAPVNGDIPIWDAAGNTWTFGVTGASNLQYFDLTGAPVGLWNFNNTLADVSGNGNNLVLSAGNPGFADIVPGKKALAIWLGTRYETAAAVPLLQILGDVTIETIIQQDGNPITNNIVLCQYRGPTATPLEANNILYQFRLQATGAFTNTRDIGFASQNGVVLNTVYSSAGTPASLGCIHNIVYLAVRREANVVTFFVNGVPFGNPSGVLTAPTGGNGANTRFCVGNNGPGTTAVEVVNLMLGLKVFNRALSDAEIKAEYNRTMGPAFGRIP